MDVYTIGHSNLDIDAFVRILRQHHIAALADVRSQPYSRHAPQFNQPLLTAHLKAAGIAYYALGDSLGGKPAAADLHGPAGLPDYDAIERSSAYQQGIAALLALAARQRTVVMCSEGDPATCHREKLIARTLRRRGQTVLHLRGDGGVVEEVQPSLL